MQRLGDMTGMTSTRAPKTIFRLSAAVLAVGALTLAACSDDKDDSSADTTAAPVTTAGGTETTAGAEQPTFEGMWARTSPMEATMGAAYLTITSPVDDALVGAKIDSSIAGMVQIHEMVMADSTGTTMAMGGMGSDTTMAMGGSDTTMAGMGEMVMQEVDKIDLPAGQAVELKPGGYHIMLMELVAPLETGTILQITLVFEKAGEITLDFPVVEEAP